MAYSFAEPMSRSLAHPHATATAPSRAARSVPGLSSCAVVEDVAPSSDAPARIVRLSPGRVLLRKFANEIMTTHPIVSGVALGVIDRRLGVAALWHAEHARLADLGRANPLPVTAAIDAGAPMLFRFLAEMGSRCADQEVMAIGGAMVRQVFISVRILRDPGRDNADELRRQMRMLGVAPLRAELGGRQTRVLRIDLVRRSLEIEALDTPEYCAD